MTLTPRKEAIYTNTRSMSISLIKPSLCPHEISLFHPEIYDSYSGQPHEKHLHYLGKQNAHPAQKKYSIMIVIARHRGTSSLEDRYVTFSNAIERGLSRIECHRVPSHIHVKS